MSVIKYMQKFLREYQDFTLRPIGEVRTDLVQSSGSSYAIAPAGNVSVVADIAGNRRYTNSYIFYAKESALDEKDRADNYDFLEAFSEWLEDQLPDLGPGRRAERLNVENVLLFDIDSKGQATYQIQLQLTYTKEGTDEL